jgi:glycine dehydrogenase subunit 1
MRYLPLTSSDRQEMLATIGAAGIDDLFIDVPAEARLDGPIAGLPNHASEMAVERHMRSLAAKNVSAGDVPFFLGAGAYRHHVPASVDHIIQRGEFLTAYTPYQPEIAQGTLQMLFEFQTQVARLYGCDIANASMYDGSTACWEAIGMAGRITKRSKAVLIDALHPHYVSVANTMARFTGDTLDVLDLPFGETPAATAASDAATLADTLDNNVSCVVVQYPDVLGRLRDLRPLAEAAHKVGALLIAVVTEPVALGYVESPGAMGADIVVGEGQSIGVGLQFGGPYLGLFGCKEKYVRHMPGRLCGQTVDADGKRGFVLTLSTREQHIRREKATSNICTNSGLCALAFSVHMTLLGETGLREMAKRSHERAMATADYVAAIPGITVKWQPMFNEFVAWLPRNARDVAHELAAKGVLGGVPLGRLYPDRPEWGNGLLIATTEMTTNADVEALGTALKEVLA